MEKRRKGEEKKVSVPAPRTDQKSRRPRRVFPSEAYDYDGEVSAEAVKQLQERADAVLGEGEWEVVDGYVGRR